MRAFVMFCMKHLLLALLISVPASAQDLSTFDRFLVPVLNQSRALHGANGSSFRTSFGALTADLHPITFYPRGADAPAIGQSDREYLEVPLWEAPVVAKGRFVFIDPSGPSSTLFAKLASVAADGSTAETPLPVVPDSSALASKSTFGVLPNDAIYEAGQHSLFKGFRQRHTLRVYDFGSGGGEVEVRLVYATWLARGAIAVKRLALTTRDFDDPSYPYYAEVDLGQWFGSWWCFPTVRGICSSSFGAIVEVVPITPGLRYYAFISTTDNVSHHVAIYTPR
jgi:hypothetical protein